MRVGPVAAGRWHASVGAKGFIIGVSRVTTLTTRQPIGWAAYIDAQPLNRKLTLKWHTTVGRYRW